MSNTPTFQPAAAGPSRTGTAPGRRVTDAPTRMFHWLFAASFLGAYLSAGSEPWRALHVTLGYTLAGLLAFRVVYGMFGPRQAGLGMMARKLASMPAWLSSLARGIRRQSVAGIPWRQGQNLLMALAVVALLVLAVPLTLSGYASYNDWAEFLGGDWISELHEFFGEVLLAVVLGHVALIAGLSLLRRRNQARPMLGGRVDGPGPDLVRHNRGWLAALLLLAVLAFTAWQWQESPAGLIPAQPWSTGASDLERDGDND